MTESSPVLRRTTSLPPGAAPKAAVLRLFWHEAQADNLPLPDQRQIVQAPGLGRRTKALQPDLGPCGVIGRDVRQGTAEGEVGVAQPPVGIENRHAQIQPVDQIGVKMPQHGRAPQILAQFERPLPMREHHFQQALGVLPIRLGPQRQTIDQFDPAPVIIERSKAQVDQRGDRGRCHPVAGSRCARGAGPETDPPCPRRSPAQTVAPASTKAPIGPPSNPE